MNRQALQLAKLFIRSVVHSSQNIKIPVANPASQPASHPALAMHTRNLFLYAYIASSPNK